MLLLGGADSRFYTGPLHYYPYGMGGPGFDRAYSIAFSDILVNGERQHVCPDDKCVGVVDSGTTALLGNAGPLFVSVCVIVYDSDGRTVCISMWDGRRCGQSDSKDRHCGRQMQ